MTLTGNVSDSFMLEDSKKCSRYNLIAMKTIKLILISLVFSVFSSGCIVADGGYSYSSGLYRYDDSYNYATVYYIRPGYTTHWHNRPVIRRTSPYPSYRPRFHRPPNPPHHHFSRHTPPNRSNPGPRRSK